MPTPRRASPTFFHHGSQRLVALGNAIGFDRALTAQAVELFRTATSPWSEEPIGDRPRWPSDITDDGTPYEFSLAIERHRPELRMLVEAQASEPTVFAQWDAGRALSEHLQRKLGAHLGRLAQIEDLFAIEDRSARFGSWHAINLRAGSKPDFKIYLNPQAKGKANAFEVVAEALSRLGFREAARALPLRADLHDEIKYFSLDLSDAAEARVKVYLAHHRATCADMESALSTAANYIAGEATEFCRTMSGSEGPYLNMALQSCYSFTTRGGDRPTAATLYFPVRAYADSDDVAKNRIMNYMIAEDRPLYERVIQAFAQRDLDLGTGMQTYAAFRRQNFFRRVTVYLSPEAYAMGPRRAPAGPVSGVMSTPNMRADHTSAPSVSFARASELA